MSVNECSFLFFFLEEEISAMKQALDKYGIQMPSFGKIGGILANELCDNDAALHAAIVAINDVIDKGVSADTVTVMQNPDSRLIDISSNLADNYQQILSESKTKKCEQCDLKGKNEADLDLYDRMLTQAEIQGHINKVNCKFFFFLLLILFCFTMHPSIILVLQNT